MCGVASTPSTENSGKPGRRRLGAEDVERGVGHFAGGDGVAERGLVDQFAARAVDDAHAVLHLREGLVGEHALRFRAWRRRAA